MPPAHIIRMKGMNPEQAPAPVRRKTAGNNTRCGMKGMNPEQAPAPVRRKTAGNYPGAD